ncbi:uncharacterized protein [Temnothorax nylanderi]|uniref:uncharacterized protein n=1 Tax=Temnothorax nylanderi TaxID=102681 RepID=UPI003A89C460
MNSSNDDRNFECGICQEKCTFENVVSHLCVQGYMEVLFTDNNQFYPKTSDGQVVTRISENESAGDTEEIDKENVNIFNITSTERSNDTTLIASMEEILISAVQDRPPLWNFKNTLPLQRTKAAKDKLWEEIADLMNRNKENKQYTTATLKQKWKNLYDTYRSYLTKEKGRSGQAAKKGKPWRHMEQMSFLKDSFDLGIKNTISNLTLPTKPDANVPDDPDLQSKDLTRSSDDVESNKCKKKKRDPIEMLAEALHKPIPSPQIVQPPLLPMPELKEKDEISNFCLTIDKKLRNLNKKQSNKAMFKIYELLFNVENEAD